MRFEKLKKNIQGYDNLSLPQMVKVKQKFKSDTIEDVRAELNNQLDINIDSKAIQKLKSKKIGISAGSRGIPFYKELLKVICDKLKSWGAIPFVFPAMGSHAGGTAESQKDFLKEYGITEEYLGAPILSSMEVVEVAKLEDGMPVYCDKYAAEADGIVLFHKVKPHTHFKGNHESGLLKMIGIGIGKHKGASTFHKKGFDHFDKYLVDVAEAFLDNINVVFGVGVIQNAYDLLGKIEVIPTDQIIQKDAELLSIAKKEMARIKFDDIDVLIIDEIGKNISGTGFDTNISGRIEVESQREKFKEIAPNIKKIVLLDISEQSHGNATGLGEADLISYRFVNKIDFATTYTNVITNNYLKAAAMPLYSNSDLDAIKIAILTGINTNYKNPKIVRIKNTSLLEEIEVSVAYIDEIKQRNDIEIINEPYNWKFNENDDLW